MKHLFCNSFWNPEGATCRADLVDLQKEYQSVWKRGAVIVPCKFLRKGMTGEGAAVLYLLFPLVWASKLARSKTLRKNFLQASLSFTRSYECVCVQVCACVCALYWHGIQVRTPCFVCEPKPKKLSQSKKTETKFAQFPSTKK